MSYLKGAHMNSAIQGTYSWSITIEGGTYYQPAAQSRLDALEAAIEDYCESIVDDEYFIERRRLAYWHAGLIGRIN